MIKAVIFDLDDTLISESEYVKSGFRAVSNYLEQQYEINNEIIYKELMHLYKENSKNIFNRWFESNKIKYTEKQIKKIVKIYRQHNPNIEFYPDVLSTLKFLKENEIKVAIITDGYIETQKAKLKVINAYKIFDEIIITDELGKEFWKPHPKAFEIMKQKLGMDFDEMIYVGDNPEKDFYISSIYNITCIRIKREDGIYKDRDYKNNVKEKYSIKNLNEIIQLIKDVQ